MVPRISAECTGMAGGDKGTVPRGQRAMATGSAKGTRTAPCTRQARGQLGADAKGMRMGAAEGGRGWGCRWLCSSSRK